MVLKIVEKGEHKDVVIKEGEVWSRVFTYDGTPPYNIMLLSSVDLPAPQPHPPLPPAL